MDLEKKDGFLKRELKSVVYAVGKSCPLRPKNAPEALELCKVLLGHRISSTMGKLSKAGDDPGEIVKEYQVASNTMKSCQAPERFYLSVKPPALQFKPEYASAIVAAALRNGQGVHFDAHGYPFTDATLEMLQDVLRRHPAEAPAGRNWSFGLTLPSRWKRSCADAEWLIEKGIRPRLVKGDFAAPASEETDPERGFLALVERLAGKVPELALATHDSRLAREAVGRCRRGGTAVELELFFGRPSSAMMALSRELQVPLRFYVPYGDTLLIYFIRDLLSNPHKLFRPDSYQILGSPATKLVRIIQSL
jgi:proline dehydrogenase